MANSFNHPRRSRQPLRFLFQISHFVSTLACLPVWLTVAAIPALRPHGKWTFRQTITARIFRAIVDGTSKVAITEKLTLEPGKEGDRFEVIETASPEYYRGPLLSEDVLPANIGATWYPAKPDPATIAKLENVVLHMHGGGFVIGDGRTEATGFLANTCLVATAGADAVLCPQYRLAGHGGRDPFPAAWQDALTAYLHLTRGLGVAPARVTLSGDSAGGNLAVALLRYLEAFGPGLGVAPPARAVLVSPWVAPLRALDAAALLADPRYASDILPVSFPAWGCRACLVAAGHGDDGDDSDGSSRWFSHLGRPFATGAPVFVAVGGAEILRADGAQWAREMAAVEGNRVEISYEEGAPHDTLLLGDVLGWEESAKGVALKIGEFIAKN